MAIRKNKYIIYYLSSGLKHYFEGEIQNGPNVICLDSKKACPFSFKEAKKQVKDRGSKWQYEKIIH